MANPGKSMNFNDVWLRVSDGIDHIYRIQAMSPKAYMELYT